MDNMQNISYVIDTGGDGHFSIATDATLTEILKTIYQSAASQSELETICVSVRANTEWLGRFILPDALVPTML